MKADRLHHCTTGLRNVLAKLPEGVEITEDYSWRHGEDERIYFGVEFLADEDETVPLRLRGGRLPLCIEGCGTLDLALAVGLARTVTEFFWPSRRRCEREA